MRQPASSSEVVFPKRRSAEVKSHVWWERVPSLKHFGGPKKQHDNSTSNAR